MPVRENLEYDVTLFAIECRRFDVFIMSNTVLKEGKHGMAVRFSSIHSAESVAKTLKLMLWKIRVPDVQFSTSIRNENYQANLI